MGMKKTQHFFLSFSFKKMFMNLVNFQPQNWDEHNKSLEKDMILTMSSSVTHSTLWLIVLNISIGQGSPLSYGETLYKTEWNFHPLWR